MRSPSRSVRVTTISFDPTRPGMTSREMVSPETMSLNARDWRSSASSREATCRAGSRLVNTPTAARMSTASAASPSRKRLSQVSEPTSRRSLGRTHTRFMPPRNSSGITRATLAMRFAPYGVARASVAVTCAQPPNTPVTTITATLSAAITENLGTRSASHSRRVSSGTFPMALTPASSWNRAPIQKAEAARCRKSAATARLRMSTVAAPWLTSDRVQSAAPPS